MAVARTEDTEITCNTHTEDKEITWQSLKILRSLGSGTYCRHRDPLAVARTEDSEISFVDSMIPQMRADLDADACRSGLVEHFKLNRMSSRNLSRSKIEFFSFISFDVSQIFMERVVQARNKHSAGKVRCFCLLGILLHTAVHLLDGLWFLFCAPLYRLYLASCVELSFIYR